MKYTAIFLVLLIPLGLAACSKAKEQEVTMERSTVDAGVTSPSVSVSVAVSTDVPSSDAGAAKMAENVQSEASMNEFLVKWLSALTRVRPEQYRELRDKDELDSLRHTDSYGWTSTFFRAETDPFKVSPPPKVSFHLDPDLLRFEYEVNGDQIMVVEHKSVATLIQVSHPRLDRLPSMTTAQQLAEVNQVGRAVLRIEEGVVNVNRRGGSASDVWRLRAPSSPKETLAFSTNPGRSVHGMHNWAVRVDAGFYEGKLYFLCYKRDPQIIGFHGNPGGFSDEFRKKYKR